MHPEDLIVRLDRHAAGFSAAFHAQDFTAEDCFFGPGCPHGIFARFRDHVDQAGLTVDWPGIAELVNALVEDRGGELDNAVCTAFLEPLARRDHPLERHLAGPARRYWESWT